MAAALLACGSDTTQPAPVDGAVTATSGFAYAPDTVTVSRNGSSSTVTFTFQTRAHTVTWLSQPSGAVVADIPSTTSASVDRSFSVAGTYNYQCSIHPSMTGTVIVN